MAIHVSLTKHLFLLILLIFSFTVSAEENFADTVDEAFVEFRFQKTGDSFFRVMMDYDEVPYLNVEDILSNWMEMQAECQIERMYCQGVMIHNGKGFWLDGQQMLFGHSDSNSDQSLPQNSLVLKDNQLWLRYDVWDKWLPTTTVWSLQRYALNMQPHFALKDDRKKLREKARLRQWQKQRKLERLAKIPPIFPTEPYRAEMRYSINATHTSDGSDTLDLNYDTGADLWKGHLEFSGNAANETERNDLISYWRYQQVGRPYYHLLEIGNTRFDSTLLAPAVDVTNGLRLDKNERVKGSGSFELRSRTDPNTEIDLIINGFLQDTFFSDDNGDFSIARRLVSSGDRITLRFYFEDGTEDERTIIIAPDNSLIVKKHQWDGALLMGDTPEGPFAHIETRYGIWDNYGVGVHLYQIPFLDSLTDEETNTLLPSIDMGWRPIPDLAMLLELSQDQNQLSYSFRSDIGIWKNQQIQFESQSIDESSQFFKSGIFLYEFPTFHRLQHAVRFAPWNILSRYTYAPDQQILEFNLDRRLSRRLNMGANFQALQPEMGDTELSAVIVGAFNKSEQSSFELSRTQSELNGAWNFRFRYTGKTENPWSKSESNFPWRANLSATILDDGDNSYSLGINWRNNRYITSTLQIDQSTVNLSVIWRDAYSVGRDKEHWQWQRHDWNHYSTGTLEGYILSPEAPGAPAAPIPGVQIRASGQQATTDDRGFYQISGLPVNERVIVKVNKNSLDASMVPVKEDIVATFRPSTLVRLNPEITWTAGLDGVLFSDKPIPTGTTVEVYREDENSAVSSAPVEDDGFFLVEGLTPSRYTIRVIGVDNPPPTKTIEIPPGTDWLGGIEIDWRSKLTDNASEDIKEEPETAPQDN